jgi:hypothetical protein
MLDLRTFMAGRPPLSTASKLIFGGLTIMIVGVLGLKITNGDYFWAVIFLGLGVASKGGIDNSHIEGE